MAHPICYRLFGFPGKFSVLFVKHVRYLNKSVSQRFKFFCEQWHQQPLNQLSNFLIERIQTTDLVDCWWYFQHCWCRVFRKSVREWSSEKAQKSIIFRWKLPNFIILCCLASMSSVFYENLNSSSYYQFNIFTWRFHNTSVWLTS